MRQIRLWRHRYFLVQSIHCYLVPEWVWVIKKENRQYHRTVFNVSDKLKHEVVSREHVVVLNKQLNILLFY